MKKHDVVRVKMVKCPYCNTDTPVQKPQIIDGNVYKITACVHCYAIIDNNVHPGRYVTV